MDKIEIKQFIRENGLDHCPECGNLKGNEIEYTPDDPDGEIASVSCANCGIAWIIPQPE